MKNYLRKNFFSLLIIIPLFVLIAVSCGDYKKPAAGQEDEIIVIADSSEYFELENSLLSVFGKIIYTPQPENLFNLTHKELAELEQYKKRKNIIFIAPLGTQSQVSQFIDNMLTDEVKEFVKNDSVNVINKYDLWAGDQLVMVITGSSLEKINKSILAENENLVHYVQKISDKRLLKSLYNDRYEQKEIEARLLKDYGWLIYVQLDYGLAVNDSVDKFIWLRRSPDSEIERWIFIHWIENASPALLNRDSIYAIRNRLTEKHYRTSDELNYVEISDVYRSTREVNFNNKYALMTQGLWRMTDKTMGGPLVNYTFYDEPTKRLYMLDASIYAPKFFKKKLIQQVDVLLQSFLTEREVTQSKKEELMKKLK